MAGEKQQDQGTPEPARTESHDPDFPEAFLQFMRGGWRDDALSVTSRPRYGGNGTLPAACA